MVYGRKLLIAYYLVNQELLPFHYKILSTGRLANQSTKNQELLVPENQLISIVFCSFLSIYEEYSTKFWSEKIKLLYSGVFLVRLFRAGPVVLSYALAVVSAVVKEIIFLKIFNLNFVYDDFFTIQNAKHHQYHRSLFTNGSSSISVKSQASGLIWVASHFVPLPFHNRVFQSVRPEACSDQRN